MSLMGVIYANETPVDEVHLGLAFLINADDISIRLPEHVNEDGLSQYQWLNPQDILITYEHVLETWSKLLLHFSPIVKYSI
jgi:predicted NUDIX family phosphoesterase